MSRSKNPVWAAAFVQAWARKEHLRFPAAGSTLKPLSDLDVAKFAERVADETVAGLALVEPAKNKIDTTPLETKMLRDAKKLIVLVEDDLYDDYPRQLTPEEEKEYEAALRLAVPETPQPPDRGEDDGGDGRVIQRTGWGWSKRGESGDVHVVKSRLDALTAALAYGATVKHAFLMICKVSQRKFDSGPVCLDEYGGSTDKNTFVYEHDRVSIQRARLELERAGVVVPPVTK